MTRKRTGPCGCGHRDPDDLILRGRGVLYFTVECRLCGVRWCTRARYAQVLAMDYDLDTRGRVE